jgi:parallel beta-helix repeat protein
MTAGHQRWTLFVALALGLAAAGAGATTYHVATDGDDGNPGSAAAPWRTLQHAVDAVGPGDVILVAAGTYSGARIEVSGTAGSPITLAADSGAAVLLDGPGAANRHDSILEVETWDPPFLVSHWHLEGFEIAGAPRYGIDLRDSAAVEVVGNRVHGSALTGIFTAFSDDVLIASNESWDNGEHGIYHSNSGDRPTVRGNLLHGNLDAGIHMNGDLSQGGDGIISGALIEDNVIWDNGAGGASGINLDGVTTSLVRNNLIFDEHASGISLYQIDGAVCSSDDRVIGNTVVVAADGRWAFNMPDPGCTGNVLADNVFYSYHSFRGSIAIATPAPAGFASDYNAVMDRFSTDGGDTRIGLVAWQALGYDAHSFLATPAELFADPAGGDYHLAPASPARDAGVVRSDLPDDLEGTPRPQGPTSDVGAYEAPAAVLFADGFESGDLSAWSSSQGG